MSFYNQNGQNYQNFPIYIFNQEQQYIYDEIGNSIKQEKYYDLNNNSDQQTILNDESSEDGIEYQIPKIQSLQTQSTQTIQRYTQMIPYDSSFLEQNQSKNTQYQNQNEEDSQEDKQLQNGSNDQKVFIRTFKEKKMGFFINRKRDFKNIFIPRVIVHQKKFYLYAEQLIDLDYIKSIAQGNDEDYFKQDLDFSIYDGLKFVNQVIHRIDNKCIEIHSECNSDIYLNDICYLSSYIDSLGDKNLHEMSKLLTLFWEQFVLMYQNMIREQSLDPLFQIHKEKRYQAAIEKFKEITKDIDQTKNMCYFLYKPNYENFQFDQYVVGYNPKMYEIIGENSYSFISHLQRRGYYDPFSKKFRLKECLQRAKDYINRQLNRSNELEERYKPSEIKTIDNFFFPAFVSSDKINLNREYDLQNNLNFKVNDLLVYNEFIIQDETILERLQKIRQQQFENIKNMEQQDLNKMHYEFDQDQFFQKYYGEEVEDLIQKGNKWFKRCGYVDLPKKKYHYSIQD